MAWSVRRVVLAIGLPGSGKSSYFARRGITPLSSDLLRGLLFDDPTDQRRPDLVFAALRYLLVARLRAGRPVTYVDATNLTRRERRPFFQIAREYGCSVDALFFDVPLETCLARNRARERRVPEASLLRMARKLKPPAAAEGFRRIVTIGLARSKARGGSRAVGVS
jgi:predicted kinase